MAAHIHGNRRYYGKMKGNIIAFMLQWAFMWTLKWDHTTKITREVQKKIEKRWNTTSPCSLCWFILFVVLCMLVGSTFSININEWAQAEMPRRENPACHRDWRWSCAVRSGQLWVEVDQLWHRQHKRRRWMSDVAASNSGWMMSVQYCVTMQQQRAAQVI